MPDDPPPSPAQTPAGPLSRRLGAPVASIVGALLEPLYSIGINHRNRRFDRTIGVTRLDRPVISVGNLSVGGTGKTPMVSRLVKDLLDQGHHPCIAMRGYAPRSSTPAPSAFSDEADLYRRQFPALPLVAQPDRTAGLRALFASPEGRGIDAVILDDGFQHRQLARDLDIVLIDATRPPFVDRLLPAGWLREPVASLARAHAIVITHAELSDPAALAWLTTSAAQHTPRAIVAVASHHWTQLLLSGAGDADRVEPIDWLADKKVCIVCALGNPGAFIAQARRRTARVVGHLVLKDHDPYAQPTIDRLLTLVKDTTPDAILTTEKDWTKLRAGRTPWPCPIVRPSLAMQFQSGYPELIQSVIQTLQSNSKPS